MRYQSKRFICGECRASTASDEYPTVRAKVGHGLASWAIHAHVALKQSFRDVTSGINDIFGYSFTYAILNTIKPRLAKQYEPTKALLLNKLRASSALYVDETKVTLHKKMAYVWAFSNLHEVLYLFNPNRAEVTPHSTRAQREAAAVSIRRGCLMSNHSSSWAGVLTCLFF